MADRLDRLTLRNARDLAGLSQRQLARRAGLKFSQISDYEQGRVRRPSHDFVVRVIRALRKSGLAGVTAEQLFPVSDDEALAS